LQVPYGTVSRNEQFWKRVDEQCVDVGTYDLLFKNGVRVGQAPISEWDYFRQVMEAHPAVTKANTLVGVEGKPIELTGLEFDILVALMRRAGRVIPRDALLAEAGRSDVVVGERTVDVHISHLRAKLGDDPRSPRRIKTVRGVGYVLSREE